MFFGYISKAISEYSEMSDKFQMTPIGVVRRQHNIFSIEIHRRYKEGLLGLNQFSHIIVFFWFDKNDTPEHRKVLRVHPRGHKANPLTGVFAARSPERPNLIGISTCKILSIDNNIIHIDQIDAFNGSPVIDIKPFIPRTELIAEAITPGWAEKE